MSERIKIYYAHCQAIYDTRQEDRDIALLEQLGFEVVNPNTEEILEGLAKFKKANPDRNSMNYFYEILEECGALAFRSTPNGMIPCGIFSEIEFIQSLALPVIELPSMINAREMDIKQTRDYLHEIGQR